MGCKVLMYCDLETQAAEDEASQTVKQVAAASILLYLCKSQTNQFAGRSFGFSWTVCIADNMLVGYSPLCHRLREKTCLEEEASNAWWTYWKHRA